MQYIAENNKNRKKQANRVEFPVNLFYYVKLKRHPGYILKSIGNKKDESIIRPAENIIDSHFKKVRYFYKHFKAAFAFAVFPITNKSFADEQLVRELASRYAFFQSKLFQSFRKYFHVFFDFFDNHLFFLHK